MTKKHIILFFLTLITTLITGYSFEGTITGAVLFSLSLLLILGTHEMGHYYYGKKYGEDITLPYFIPAPPLLSIIGTFGAFIKIKSQIKSNKALFDIGILWILFLLEQMTLFNIYWQWIVIPMK